MPRTSCSASRDSTPARDAGVSLGAIARVWGRRCPPRRCQFRSRRGRRLGRWDQLVEWVRPKARPAWMTAEQFDSLPPTLPVREVRYQLAEKGMRTRRVTVATTLLDPKLYPKDKVAELYGLRWRAETHFAELKTTLKMRKLKSRTADGVR
ncbi:MAG TPA: transposase, partial [Tepidisphaeraceae bacterium]|nr:transposase [Tepidisphaeraceae bacterium]